MEEEELSQADLSQLRLQEMTPLQRAELRRRYDRFVRHFVRTGAVAPRHGLERPQRPPKKWLPGAKS